MPEGIRSRVEFVMVLLLLYLLSFAVQTVDSYTTCTSGPGQGLFVPNFINAFIAIGSC